MTELPVNPFRCNVVPDRVDLRDRPYQPPVRRPPPSRLNSLRDRRRPIALDPTDQEKTSACTGFALANVISFLLQDSGRVASAAEATVSPFMLYSMARRYDEFPDNDPDARPEGELDIGSSLRGAMKGWYKHGACATSLWETLAMPPGAADPAQDWWPDAAKRPLGAYYRVNHQSITDMHGALADVGILYASATCHAGWQRGLTVDAASRQGFRIPFVKASPADGGHAFAIVGYDEVGFLVLNSWGKGWADTGLATLGYEDWLEHGMDCWVAQLGVVTQQHLQIAAAPSLRVDDERVVVSAEPVLRNREIGPFIVNMENDGRLSRSGDFRTCESDLSHLVTTHLQTARRRWGLAGNQPIDVAIYAHGGLVGESRAALAAAEWIPALYQRQIFPIFFMWETDLWSTLKNQLEDSIADVVRPAGGLGDVFVKWWNERLERTLAKPGSLIWSQMKQNAQAISRNPESGANKLYELCQKVDGFKPDQVRLHLIGHSAGSIVHCHLVQALSANGYRFATVNFMAPAVQVRVFERTVLAAMQAGQVRAYNQFHLSDDVEQKDPSCRPILGYNRSLLFLVSESFEGGKRTAILGMERYFDDLPKQATIKSWSAPGNATASTTHGGFDEDPKTLRSVIRCIKDEANA